MSRVQPFIPATIMAALTLGFLVGCQSNSGSGGGADPPAYRCLDVLCDDGDPCTDDSCNPETGACEYTDNTHACDDGDACTEDDTCRYGTCRGTPVICDDGDLCTSDTCLHGECLYTEVVCQAGWTCIDGECIQCTTDADCDDGLFCNGAETCTESTCYSGLVPCVEGDTCNESQRRCETLNTEALADQNPGVDFANLMAGIPVTLTSPAPAGLSADGLADAECGCTWSTDSAGTFAPTNASVTEYTPAITDTQVKVVLTCGSHAYLFTATVVVTDDACPDDPDKIAPGFCGCGTPDTDTDADGTPDCADECPEDSSKTEPGKCGCCQPEVANCGSAVAYLSEPQLIPDTVFVSEATEVVVRIAIAADPPVEAGSVKLLNVGNTCPPLDLELATLNDDGNVSNGDDIAGDGVFSARITVNKGVEGRLLLRVVAALESGVNGYSEIGIVNVWEHLATTQIEEAAETLADTLEMLPSPGVKFTEEEFQGILVDLVDALNAAEAVAHAASVPNSTTVTVRFTSGIVYVLDFAAGGTLRYPRASASLLTDPRVLRDVRFVAHGTTAGMPRHSMHIPPAQTHLPMAAGAFIGSANVSAYLPFYWDLKEDLGAGAFTYPDSPFTVRAITKNYEATIEAFKSLLNDGVILIETHGTVGFHNISQKDASKWYSAPIFMTGLEATSQRQQDYASDLKAERLMIRQARLLIKDGGWFWFDSKERVEGFCITHKFVDAYLHDLPDSLVYLACCKGLKNNRLAQSFLDHGAATVIGYTESVLVSYNSNCSTTFIDEMLDGKSADEALAAAIAAHGQDDGGNPPAAIDFRGLGSLKLFKEDLLNGGFEDAYKYWDTSGDVRVLSQLGPLTPPQGVYMAILSSGLGSIDSSSSEASQGFKVPASATTLSFDYDVISEEPMEFVGGAYDDQFEVAIVVPASGDETVVASESVNESVWLPIEGIDFDGGDQTVYHTEWQHVEFDITPFVGQHVSVRIRVWDSGDSAYDTAALLDAFAVQ